MKLRKFRNFDPRTMEEIRHHYNIEKSLANELRQASRDERKTAYSRLYDQLFKMVPNHPQLLAKTRTFDRKDHINRQMKILSRFLSPDITFLELGAGDCELSFSVAKMGAKVYAVDVSEQITNTTHRPTNFHMIISDGITIDVTPQSIDLAYSCHLMEHLHPDDVIQQLKNVYTALAPGGIYVCITPHRFNGPHDVSRLFDLTATGFHLKEYTNTEIYSLFKNVGFAHIKSILAIKSRNILIPIVISIILEATLDKLPYSLKSNISAMPLFSNILGIRIISRK